MERKTTRLKRLIENPKLLVMPGAFDALSALLIERAGFEAVQISGLGVAASVLGKPDIGVLGLRDMVERVFHIAGAVSIPVMADGDTGYGNAVNAYYTVQEMERAGAAGINLEDQIAPKRCGHMEGKEVVPLTEMVLKVRAARAAAKDPDFVINARTDALGVLGLDEAVRRGNAFAEAGATLIFVEGVESTKQIRDLVQRIKAPVSINLAEGGRTPLLTFSELEQMEVSRVSCPGTALFAAMRGIETALRALKANDGPADHAPQIANLADYRELIGWPRVRELESAFLDPDALRRKYDR